MEAAVKNFGEKDAIARKAAILNKKIEKGMEKLAPLEMPRARNSHAQPYR